MFKIAILGSGNTGTDLLIKTLRSPYLKCNLFTSRNLSSSGMSKALSLNMNVSDQGIDAITKNPECCDLVFDATSALSHKYHVQILHELDKVVINLTPANIGHFCIPVINLSECINYKNLNMVTCGGQASIPLLYVIGQTQKEIDYIEVVSTIASRSAGPATRLNIDEYIETTEKGIELFSKCKKVKAILNLNPAEPCIDMQTTIYALVKNPDLDILKKSIGKMVQKIQRYIPGYNLIIPPTYENNRIVISVRVRGLGDHLPIYAGNLDIMNCAAITVAEEYAKLMNFEGINVWRE